MKLLTIILLIFFTSSCKPQSKQDLLVGTWHGVKKELNKDKEGANPLKNNFILTFRSDFTGKDDFSGDEFKYSVNGSYLLIGNRKYLVLKLTETELVLLTQSDLFPDNPLAKRLYFEKQPL